MGLSRNERNLLRRSATKATWNQSSFGGSTGYSATNLSRKILQQGGRPKNATANELLTANLPSLRAWCRQLERNNPTARAGVEALTALVVGTGIALEPDTGDEKTNEAIREQWVALIEHIGVDGSDLYQLQTRGYREVATAGELLWRYVILPEREAAKQIPLAILPLEAEWLDEQNGTTIGVEPNGDRRVGPILYDRYGRPKSFRLRHPEAQSVQEAEEIPARLVVHEYEKRRSLQGRGEPPLAPLIETLQQERDLVDAELKSAQNTAAMAMVVTSDFHDGVDTTEEGTPEDPAQSVRLGGVGRLAPGDKIEAFSHTRPSQQIKPFREMLRGDIAAALRIPSRFLDRDVSRANYSSMRADMIDTERILGPVREWYGHATAGRLYLTALPYLCVRAGIPMPKKTTYRLLPDGQPYVDPYKDAQAAQLAIAAGLTTWESEIAKRGGDYRKVWKQLAVEHGEAAGLGLTLDLSATNAPAPESTVGKQIEQATPDPKGFA